MAEGFSVDDELLLQQQVESHGHDVAFYRNLEAQTEFFFHYLQRSCLAQLFLAVLAILSSITELSLNSILLWRNQQLGPLAYMSSGSYLLTTLVCYSCVALILFCCFRLLVWWFRKLRRGLLRWLFLSSYTLLLLFGLLTLAVSLALNPFSLSSVLTLVGVALIFVIEFAVYWIIKDARINSLRYLCRTQAVLTQKEEEPPVSIIAPPTQQPQTAAQLFHAQLVQDVQQRKKRATL